MKSLLPGTAVSVVGYQAKDGSKRANGRDLTFKDTGETLFLGSSGTGAPYELTPDNVEVEEDEAFGQRGQRVK